MLIPARPDCALRGAEAPGPGGRDLRRRPAARLRGPLARRRQARSALGRPSGRQDRPQPRPARSRAARPGRSTSATSPSPARSAISTCASRAWRPRPRARGLAGGFAGGSRPSRRPGSRADPNGLRNAERLFSRACGIGTDHATMEEAAIARFYYETRCQLPAPLADFIMACTLARQLRL